MLMVRRESRVSNCGCIVNLETVKKGIFELWALVVLFIFKIVFVRF